MIVLALAAPDAAPAPPPPPPPAPVVSTPPPGRPSIITRPTYARVPGANEMARHYPGLARVIGVEGRVTLLCSVAATGQLQNCQVDRESPRALGFGEAALNVAPLIRMRPGTVDGVPIDGGMVLVPVLFAIPDRPLPDLQATLYCYGMLGAYSASRPGERRLAVARDRARLRAGYLMTEAGTAPEAMAATLDEAVAAGAARPVHHPGKPTDVDDRCLRVFLA
jgi:TonB family protein